MMNRTVSLLGTAMLLATATSAGNAADLGVLTALDTCNALSISGLTLASDSNCLLISGGTYYEFSVGNYAARLQVLPPLAYTDDPGEDEVTVIDNDGTPDWYSYAEAWLRFEAVAESDFGPARAVIDFYGYQEYEYANGVEVLNDHTGVTLDYAYVAIGDTTVITAGLNDDSILSEDDDDPFDWLGTANSNLVDTGVAFDNANGGTYDIAGHVITAVTDFGNGFRAGAGLEGLEADGSAVGFVAYGADDAPLSGYIGLVAGDILDGSFDDWAMRAAVTASLEAFRGRAALSLNDTGWWNVLFSGEATFEMFTLAATVDGTSEDELGASASVKAEVSDTVTLWGGVRWTDADTTVADDEGFEVAARVDFAASDTLLLGAGLANLWTGPNAPAGEQSILAATGSITWTPSEGFTATAEGLVNALGGYKTTITAEKTFE